MKNSFKQALTQVASSKKIRFALVGVVNTVVDFTVLNTLVTLLGIPLIPSNIASTTAAMLVSFTLNKKTVFRGSDSGGARQVIAFFAVTLIGIWLVQTLVLVAVHTVLVHVTQLPDVVAVNAAKIVGICFSLVWNYMWYSRVVFKSGKK